MRKKQRQMYWNVSDFRQLSTNLRRRFWWI